MLRNHCGVLWMVYTRAVYHGMMVFKKPKVSQAEVGLATKQMEGALHWLFFFPRKL